MMATPGKIRMRKLRAARASAGLPANDFLRAWVGDAVAQLAEAGAIDADLLHMIAIEVGRAAESKGKGDADAVVRHLIDRWK